MSSATKGERDVIVIDDDDEQEEEEDFEDEDDDDAEAMSFINEGSEYEHRLTRSLLPCLILKRML